MDFTGAVFDGGDLTRAHFSGGEVSFVGATFSGGVMWCAGARFLGGQVSFSQATFSGGEIWFSGIWFSGAKASFSGATFSAGKVLFSGPLVRGEISFREAMFPGGEVSFDARLVDGVTVLMPPYDPGAAGWPTRDGRPFYGWPPPVGTEDAPGDKPRPADPAGT